MGWVYKVASAGSVGYSGAGVTSRSATCAGTVAVGDLLCLGVALETLTGSATGTSLSDQLGNVYVRQEGIADGSNKRLLDVYRCRVTVAGTPVVTVQFLPTPGSTTTTAVDLIVDPFTGSNLGSSDDNASSQFQVLPGTGTDAVTSGPFARTHDGDLLYGASQNSTTPGAPPVNGTSFTTTQTTASLTAEYAVEGSHASTAVTFTGDVGNHLTAAFAETVGVIVDDSDQQVVTLTQAPVVEVPVW